MSTAIDDAINQAKAQAAQTAEASTAVATTVQQPQTQVATYQASPVSLDDLTTGSMAVDDWLKVKEFGLFTGSKDTIFKEVKVAINMSEVLPTEVIKAGNPANYFHTVDRVTCREGGTWAEAIAKARQIDPMARPYLSADIPMTVLEDVKVGDEVIVEAGTVLGHSTSTTNRQNLAAFLKEVKEKGLDEETVEVKITAQKRVNQKGNVWGVLQFELLG